MNGRMRVAMAVVLALVAGCSDAPAAPGGPFEGSWFGPFVDSAGGAGTARLVLTQSGAGLSGTFTMALTNPPNSADQVGTVSGTTTTKTTASIFLKPSTPLSCGLSGTMGGAVSLSGLKLTGNFSAVTCTGAVTGTLDLARQ